MVTYLTEVEVRSLLTLPMAIETTERAFRDRADGLAFDTARRRTRTPAGHLHIMHGASLALGRIGFKYYTGGTDSQTTLVHLHEQPSGRFLAMIEAYALGMLRTAAATALATRLLARADASVVACFGTGRHGGPQLEAVCAVRRVTRVRAFGRDRDRRDRFCREMSQRLSIPVEPADTPAQALAGADIVNIMTRSDTPVFDGNLLEPGQHINAAGGNAQDRRELDLAAVGRCGPIVVDSREAARVECGDLLPAFEAGMIRWDECPDLGDVLIGRRAGRTNADQITLFESQGISTRRTGSCAKRWCAGSVSHYRSEPPITSISFRLKAGMSSGFRLETMPPSTTTSSSTQRAPALVRSVFSEGHEVIARPFTTPASIKVHGP
jgi:alanine dehydrogenase